MVTGLAKSTKGCLSRQHRDVTRQEYTKSTLALQFFCFWSIWCFLTKELGAQPFQPKLSAILVQTWMDWFGPTGHYKFGNEVHLLKRTACLVGLVWLEICCSINLNWHLTMCLLISYLVNFCLFRELEHHLLVKMKWENWKLIHTVCEQMIKWVFVIMDSAFL